MPKRNDDPDIGSDVSKIDAYAKQLQELNERYAKMAAQAKKAVGENKALQATLKAQKKAAADAAKATKAQNSALKGQAQFAKQAVAAYRASHAAMQRSIKTQERMLRSERKLMRQRERIARMSGRGGAGLSSGLSIGSVAGIGLVYAGLRKIQTLVERQIQGAIVAGVPAVGSLRRSLPPGVVESRALGLLGGIQGASPTLRFGTQGVPEATAALAQSVKGLGDAGTDLVAHFVSSLEPALQRSFIQAVNAQGVQAAVSQFASGQNIGLATSLLNAQGMSSGATGDPLIDAALNVQQSTDALNASIEKLIGQLAQRVAPLLEKIAGMVEKSPGAALGVGAGALLLGSGAGRGALRLGARGVGAAGKAALPLLANPFGAAAAVGLGGAFAIDHLTHEQSLRDQFRAVGDAQAMALGRNQRLAEIARSNAGTLKGHKQALTAKLSQYEIEHQRGAISQLFGRSAYSAEDEAAIKRMREEIQRLTREIKKSKTEAERLAQSEEQLTAERKASERLTRLQQQAARRAEIEPLLGVASAQSGLAQEMITSAMLAPFRDMRVPLTQEQQAFQSALTNQIGHLEQLLQTIDTSTAQGQTEAAGIRTEIGRLRNEQARQSQMAFQLQMSDYADKLNLLRLQYQVQSTTPVGIIGAVKDLEILQRGLSSDISRINEKVRELREKGSIESLREARKLEQTALGMELELRQLRMQAMTALLDSVVQQAMSSANFEKILITQNQNLGLALDKALIKSMPYITGISGEAARKHHASPIPALKYYSQTQPQTGMSASATGRGSSSGIIAPLKRAEQGANDLIGIAEARLEVAKATQRLTTREIALLEEYLGAESEGVPLPNPAQTGGKAL